MRKISNPFFSSLLGGATSGAAGSAGTGQAGQASAAGAVGGVGQGGLNGMAKIKQIYVMQAYQQSIHYALCLVQHGHTYTGGARVLAELASRIWNAPECN